MAVSYLQTCSYGTICKSSVNQVVYLSTTTKQNMIRLAAPNNSLISTVILELLSLKNSQLFLQVIRSFTV